MEMKEHIGKGETQNLEFKKSLRLKDEIGETVSAFSNSDGGTILVGVSDDGGILGVDIGKNTIEELANYIKRNTDPQIFPRIEITETKDGAVILIDVAENQEKPVFFKDKAYKRVGKTNQRISTSEIRRLAMEERKRLGWDEQFCEEACLEDIEEDKVRWFLRKSKEERGLAIEEDAKIYGILTQLNLLQDTKLANAALLLFVQQNLLNRMIRTKPMGATYLNRWIKPQHSRLKIYEDRYGLNRVRWQQDILMNYRKKLYVRLLLMRLSIGCMIHLQRCRFACFRIELKSGTLVVYHFS
jgi:predicted HTH transcriptional regulator